MRDTASRPPLATHRNLAASTPLIPLQSSIHRDLEMQLAKKSPAGSLQPERKGEEGRRRGPAAGRAAESQMQMQQPSKSQTKLGSSVIL